MASIQPSRRTLLGGLAAALIASSSAALAEDEPAAGRVEKNVVFGMYSGLALLLDVHHPPKSNGLGIIFIPGSGFQAPLGTGTYSIKDSSSVAVDVKPLVDAGYTVFAINHRAAPRFRYPAAQEDAQRAVRYVRHHAKEYGIRPDRIGATGSSSGGCLAMMLAVLDGAGVPDDADSVARESAKVQCVVAINSGSDNINAYSSPATPVYLGMELHAGSSRPYPPSSLEYKVWREASPIAHVTEDDPPCLLIHGDADEIISFKHSELMEEALKKAGVAVKLVRIKGWGHVGPVPKGEPLPASERVQWFDKYLQTE